MPQTPILNAMLQRLYASMAKGPSLNARPHASRVRIDLTHIDRLRDIDAASVLRTLLGEKHRVTIAARVPMPPQMQFPRFGQEQFPAADEVDSSEGGVASSESDPQRQAWLQQRSLLTKLRNLSEEARTYEQDTGVHALYLGYPMLSLPPGALGAGASRVLAPIAFIPVSLTVRTGHKAGFDLECYGRGVDLVIPNAALIAWLERQTGKAQAERPASDDEAERPWEEIGELIAHVRSALDLQANTEADASGDALFDPQQFRIEPIAKAEDLPKEPAILPSAVLGLFPMSNESLLRDTQAMIEADRLDGPIASFIDSNVRLEGLASPDAPTDDNEASDAPTQRSPRRFADERLVAAADPCQARTVAKARSASGLVVHGPPGTGKSQTITNIIGDHLARGERVLFVCEKRTALDVVANRLEHIGLGGLCALVHDPQRDQRDLYMAIRAQLDALPETKTNARAERELEQIDKSLQRLHDELAEAHRALMAAPNEQDVSFHELMGQWLSIKVDGDVPVVAEDLERAKVDELASSRQDIEMILRRGRMVDYPVNAWRECIGVGLEAFLSRPAEEMRRALASCVEDARAADATRHANIPPFNDQQSLAEQVRIRNELARNLQRAIDTVDAAIAKRISAWSAETVQRFRAQLQECAAHVQVMRDGALDAELAMILNSAEGVLNPVAIAQRLGAIGEYLAIASRWHGFLHFGVRRRAAQALRTYGLPLSIDSAQRVRKFLIGLRARLVLSNLCEQLRGETTALSATTPPLASGSPKLPADETLDRTITQYAAALDALAPALGVEALEQATRNALSDASAAATLLDGLRRSEARAAALDQLEQSLRALNLFDSNWLAKVTSQVRAGRKAADTLLKLQEQFDTIEGVLRITSDLQRIPAAFVRSVEAQLHQGVEPEAGLAALRRGVLAGEIGRRIAADPALRQLDGDRIVAMFDHYRQLEYRKRGLVRDVILHRWRTKQKDRLLASTGSRLNSDGAKLRQRLFVRGKRAMRLRQVIALGQDAADDAGDPLFDLCPVWMASPSTVAQIFPLRPLFDVVIFDEASQCKLEEALPVLTRAKRVVIAGDPKQLPPTRFFEASITESDAGELETDQDMFEFQQSEIEDLLTAALHLEIEESYLDVHYRSRNADLIEFSNQQFYHDRLQAIPGHPANRTRFAPITLHRVQGVYDKRCNPAEARRVCEIVRDLLKRAEPPSIGIACFNLTQRDLVLEMLDDLALEDASFAARLAAARERHGEGSFEGLFVKNLENVQGDERDHIIISTTYGPNPQGRFYRRFGPLGMPGGGRRLNVLVTRARHEVHLVTSIPREAYLNVEPVPTGQTPNGGWLLFSYLRYAEELAELYEINHRVLSEAQQSPTRRVVERPIEPFSPFSLAVAKELARSHELASDVHWGNAGFRIDIALHHPRRIEDMAVGLLCDFAAYARAQDQVEWDIFRTMIHESQGWTLQRIWSPQYFRDRQRVINSVVRQVQTILANETEPSAERP